jgi:hypothetical protein
MSRFIVAAIASLIVAAFAAGPAAAANPHQGGQRANQAWSATTSQRNPPDSSPTASRSRRSSTLAVKEHPQQRMATLTPSRSTTSPACSSPERPLRLSDRDGPGSLVRPIPEQSAGTASISAQGKQ